MANFTINGILFDMLSKRILRLVVRCEEFFVEHKIDFTPHRFLVRLVEVSVNFHMIGSMFQNIIKKSLYIIGIYGSL